MYIYIYIYICIISALGVRGLFSSRTPMEYHAHPTLETTGLEHYKYNGQLIKSINFNRSPKVYLNLVLLIILIVFINSMTLNII
jgi:hypothetical protein